MKPVEKLKEIRDNLHKKTYLRKLVGDSDDLIKLMEFILKITDQMTPIEEKDPNEVHHVIHRICTRIFSISMYRLREKYWEEKANKAFEKVFKKLCDIKWVYWKLYLKSDEYKNYRKEIKS